MALLKYTVKVKTQKQQRGMVLILVLMVFALAAVISGELSYDSHREMRRTANILHSNESYLFARGGETFAIQKLLADFSYDKQSGLVADYLTELWAVESNPYDVNSTTNNDTSLETGNFVQDDFLEEGPASSGFQDIGELIIVIEDLQARFNVNNVQFKKQGHVSGEQQLSNVMGAVLSAGKQEAHFVVDGDFIEGDDDSSEPHNAVEWSVSASDLALAVKDWVGVEDNSALPGGGDDNFYEQKTPAYRAANQAIFDISELMAIKGFDVDEFTLYQTLVPKRFEVEQAAIDSQGESELGYEQEIDNGFEQDGAELQYDADGNVIPELPSAQSQWGGVEHYFSALPFPSKMNVNTASAMALQAFFSAEQAQKIITGRQGSPYQQVNDIFLNLEEIKTEERERYTSYLSVNSQYFLATSIATIGETRFTLRSKLYRDEKGQIRVLSRDFSQ